MTCKKVQCNDWFNINSFNFKNSSFKIKTLKQIICTSICLCGPFPSVGLGDQYFGLTVPPSHYQLQAVSPVRLHLGGQNHPRVLSVSWYDIHAYKKMQDEFTKNTYTDFYILRLSDQLTFLTHQFGNENCTNYFLV